MHVYRTNEGRFGVKITSREAFQRIRAMGLFTASKQTFASREAANKLARELWRETIVL